MIEAMVSIVMTYYERAEQFKNTLRSFIDHGYGENIEVVVVDDGSVLQKAQSPDFTYNFKLRIVYLRPENKWYSNPCVPFNKGFSEAVGDIVIVQNAECLHKDNIVKHALAHVNEKNYLSYACYSINKEKTGKLSRSVDLLSSVAEIPVQYSKPLDDGRDGWYNHSRINPVAYHFCSALSKNNLSRLGGFDERYARGIAYDDNEFLERIRRLPLDVSIVDEAVVVHQYHYTNKMIDRRTIELLNKNKLLFETYTKKGGNSKDYVLFLVCYNVLRPVLKYMQSKKYLLKSILRCSLSFIIKLIYAKR
jgi:glycosyltransferase involved in cell wall biosynthesis